MVPYLVLYVNQIGGKISIIRNSNLNTEQSFAYNTNKRSYSEANRMKKELQRAIGQQQHIEIIYLGSEGKATKRTIRPLQIAGDRLKAYCLQRRAPRVFIIDSILAIQPVVVRHAAGY